MKGEPDRMQMEAWRAFLVAHARLTDVLEHELRVKRHLPLTWYDVLVQLEEKGGQLRMNELARAVLLSKSGLTRLVDRLCAAGLVQRTADPGDRRGVKVTMTPEGRKALVESAPVHLLGIERHFGGLISDEEATVIRDALRRVADGLDA